MTPKLEQVTLPHPLEKVQIPKEGIIVVRIGKAFYCICQCGNCDNRYFLPYKTSKLVADPDKPHRYKREPRDYLICTRLHTNSKGKKEQCGTTIEQNDLSEKVEALTKEN